MKKFLFIIFLILSFFTRNTESYSSNKPRVWNKIPKFMVYEHVEYFLNENRITNCYEYLETSNNLLLKCWRDNKLTDVSIDINPSKKEKKFTFMGLSVVI
jgi:hypothetical protein